MKVSVLIPAYNSAATIQTTLDSVLRQTVPPTEILVLDDGSTDDTASLLDLYKPRVTVFHQKNRGTAAARNALCERSRGDLVAFLDNDDIWHPRYLETQCRLFADYPSAVAFFAGHVDFYGYGTYVWEDSLIDVQPDVELIAPLNFLKRYNECPGPFGSMSFCCVPRQVLTHIGEEPFCIKASGADDFYLFNLLPRMGPLVYTSMPLVAYRITNENNSRDQLKVVGLSVTGLEVLSQRCTSSADTRLDRQLRFATASRRRGYAKILMGAGNVLEARRQLWTSLRDSSNLFSKAKSASLLFLTCMPDKLQPAWPCRYRQALPEGSTFMSRETDSFK